MEQSLYKFYTVGIVTQHKERKSVKIKFAPAEITPDIKGNLSTYKQAPKVSQAKLAKGTHTSQHVADDQMEAIWLQGYNSQRVTPPDVRQGEKVFIYTYGDSMQYFWVSTEIDQTLRRHEHVIWKFGNRTKPLQPWGDDGCWTLEVNTYPNEKMIRLKTGKGDGEKYSFDLSLDIMSGVVSLKDGNKQSVNLNSESGSISAKANNSISLDAPNISLNGECSISKNLNVRGNFSCSKKCSCRY